MRSASSVRGRSRSERRERAAAPRAVGSSRSCRSSGGSSITDRIPAVPAGKPAVAALVLGLTRPLAGYRGVGRGACGNRRAMADQPLDLDEALARVLGRARPLPAETVPLRKALGMTLHEDVVSALAIQPFDTSAMDGFAVRAADPARTPATLHLVGESRAGRPAR